VVGSDATSGEGWVTKEVIIMVKELSKKIHWLGHDSFRMDASKTIYLDPYEVSSGPRADLILVSHEHFDHCSPKDVKKIQGPQTIIVTEKDSAKKLSGNVKILRSGDTIAVGEVKIRAVPSYNTDKDFHPKKNGWLGYILDVDGVKIYHAGDTDFIPEMKDFRVDVALLPVSGTYVMKWDEAVQAALAINPRLAIPMHYGAIVGGQEDALKFKEALEGKIEVVILPKE
jgi:L-ascorbate metabolism protein UlaG (beta-lactamase superfamily)